MKKIILALFFLSIAPLAQAQTPLPWSQQYSADQEMHLPGGQVITSKFFIDNQKIRTETTVQGMQVTSIMRMDQKMMYMVMPAQKMVTQMPLDMKDAPAASPFSSSNLKYELVGEGEVLGVACQKYKISVTSNQAYISWINKQTHLPVLVEAEDGSLKIYSKNVAPGPQPASLFEVPQGYKMMKVPAPGQPPK